MTSRDPERSSHDPIRLKPNISKISGDNSLFRHSGRTQYNATVAIVCCEAVRPAILATAGLLVIAFERINDTSISADFEHSLFFSLYNEVNVQKNNVG